MGFLHLQKVDKSDKSINNNQQNSNTYTVATINKKFDFLINSKLYA